MAKEYSAIMIDDCGDVRMLCKRALSAEGIICDTFEDAEQAEERLRDRNYDVILSDLRMPKKHGHKLMTELKEQGNNTPFVVITGVTDPRIIRDLFKRGAIDVITKPLNFVVMAVRIRHLLESLNKPPQILRQEPVAELSPSDRMSKQLEGATAFLQQQLQEVTKSFETTIAELNKRSDSLESGYLGSVRILANLIERVGQNKRSHAVRVEEAVEAIARMVGYPESELLDLRIAALLHEIGAFGMPDAIRQKPPWELDPEDRIYYQRYPEIGATFLSELKDAKPTVEMVECHAEHFDGSGFPENRSRDSIPLGARILRVADGCDTFLMHCALENKLEALQMHLMQEKDQIYDPRLVPVAIEYFDRSLRNTDETFLLPVSELREGLILGENIFDSDGRFLVREGVELTESLCKRIRRLVIRREIRVREPQSQVDENVGNEP